MLSNARPLANTATSARFIRTGQLLASVALLGIWQLASLYYQSIWLPQPALVVERLTTWAADGTLGIHAGTTALECLLGLSIGGSVALVLGLLLGYFHWPRRVLYPIALLCYAIPLSALAPAFTSLFGLGIASKVVLAGTTAYFLIFFGVLNGIDSIEQRLIDNFHLMGATAREVLVKLFVPASRLWLLTGLRTAGPFTITTAITAEIWGSRSGLGFLVKRSVEVADIAGMYAVLLVLGLLGVAINAVIETLSGEKGAV
jgi:NitT/TauT family transport system permease protein